MLLFSIIAIVLIFFLWFNTSVFDYKYNYKKGYFMIDISTERRLPFTIWRIIGLTLLLIPWWNIGIFIIYIIWYIKRGCEPDESENCIIYGVNVERYSPFLYDTICFIWEKYLLKIIVFIREILNKRIV